MYVELNEELINSIDKKLIGDYEIKGNLVPGEYIENLISDLIIMIDELEEKIEDLKNNEEFEPYEEYGISEKDF